MLAESWIRTDEAEDVAGSVRHAVRCWTLTPGDPQAWKWVLLALHSALQGACISHLVTTASPLGIITDRNAREWVEYLESSRTDSTLRPPKTHLMGLPELLKAARKPGTAGSGYDMASIQLSDEEFEWLKRFHRDIRNQFVHLSPQGWHIEVSGVPDLAKLVARLIGEIMDIGWAFRRKPSAWRLALRSDLTALSAMAMLAPDSSGG